MRGAVSLPVLPTVTPLPALPFAAGCAGRTGLHPASSPQPAIPPGWQGYVQGGSKQGAQPALAEVGDGGLSASICGTPCTSPLRRLPFLCVPREEQVQLHQPRAAAFIQGTVAVLLPISLLGVFWRCRLGIWVPRYRVTRVLDSTGLPALSLPLGEQDPLWTLLQEMQGWQPALSSHQEAPGS